MTSQEITTSSPSPAPFSPDHIFPAFIIGGTASGCGKTTITLGIMAALKVRGLTVQPFKCGPDFIDPSLHRMVTGEISSNLDLCMCGEDFCRAIFQQRMIDHGGSIGETVAVVEGVMGLFDGGHASSAALALALDLPVVLVIEAGSAAESAAAVLKGFELFDPRLQIKGVIFNRVDSATHQALIRKAVEQSSQIKILGFFPRNIHFEIPDRHLGLHMGEELPLNDGQLRELAATIETHIDLDGVLSLAAGRTSQPVNNRELSQRPASCPRVHAQPLKLAVARDLPFCFYYEDNLTILEKAGFDLLPFSPLHDQQLPEGIDALYLGGGYPELHAATLSRNLSMRASIAAWAASGGVVYAECGGFMYLCEELIDLEGKAHAMAGVFPATVQMQSRLSRLGYRQAILKRDCLWGKKGEILHGHEFHYSRIVQMAPEVETLYQLEDGRSEGFRIGNTVGGYLHLHFGRAEPAVSAFYHFIKQIQEKKRSD
jgi:cobyrinic acid a,c-diamide synthase